MSLSTWWTPLHAARSPRRPPNRFRPRLEPLEGRTAPAVLTVTTAADETDPSDGAVSLREAILSTNANADSGADVAADRSGSYAAAPNADTIDFNVAGSGVHTITLGSDLQTFTDPVILDAYSQPGASPNTLAAGDNAAIRIELDANGHFGLGVFGGGATIRGLALVNAAGSGIELIGGRDVVAGNFVGLRADGMTVAANTAAGVDLATGVRPGGAPIESRDVRIGGTDPADRNVISGNGGDGITALGTSDDVVQGNFIGTDASGTQRRGNGGSGVTFQAGSVDNAVGGAAAGAGNVISGNMGDGVVIGSGSFRNAVQRNLIGTDAGGAQALGNGGNGVTLQYSSAGVGSQPFGNLIGGDAGSAGNTIAHNGGAGVAVLGNSDGDAARRNAIFANGGLGIDLGANGVTPNDPGDGDSGPDGLQNFPVLASAASGGGGTTVTGVINTNANTALLIDFYANATADPSGFGEGQTYLGSAPVVTDGSGNATFAATFLVAVPIGQLITATATTVAAAPYGDTSEFSQALNVAGPAPVPVPADTTPPAVDRFAVVGTARKTVTQIVQTFSEATTRAGAQDLNNYVLTLQTGRGSTPLALSSALYDSAAHSVTLTLLKPLSVRSLGSVTFRARGDRNLTDLAGNLLDGDANGTPGGDFVRRLSDATFLPAP